MSRTVKLLAIAGLVAALASTAFPASAHEDRPSHTTRDGREALRLECRWVKADTGPAVGCRWSPSHHPSFAEYRLVRGERGGGHSVVFRSDDRRHTHHLDGTADPTRAYVYVVVILDGRGEMIGRSEPAAVRPGRPSLLPGL